MQYIKLVISIADEYQEIFIAELLDLDFDAFEQQDDLIITYIPKQSFDDASRSGIEQLLAAYPGDGHIQSEDVVADKNWNQQWEQTIKGRQIGSFFVRPTWSTEQAPENTLLVQIDPKMAFGTGYHETTRLILLMLAEVITPASRVMDAGTGTGILAIASVKSGAASVLAFDIDEWSITNAKENILLNDVSDSIDVYKGSIEVAKQDDRFDVILANIQRNTIIELMPSFKKHLKASGSLLLSGLLKKDLPAIENALNRQKIKVEKRAHENGWIALKVSLGL